MTPQFSSPFSSRLESPGVSGDQKVHHAYEEDLVSLGSDGDRARQEMEVEAVE